MRGRRAFALLQPLIVATGTLLKVLPRAIRVFLFDLFALMPSYLGVGTRYCLAYSLAKQIGQNVYIGRFCVIRNWESLTIGSNCSIHDYCYLDALGGLTIGSDVSVAHGSSLLSFDHTYQTRDVPIRDQPLLKLPLTLGDDVWVGAGCRLLGGVTIHTRVVIAAGAVVTKDVSESLLVGGVPAKMIKRL